jgi:hypothetical protein
MYSFKLYITEGFGNNEAGVYHELLVGRHLNKNKKHMHDPKGRPGESSKAAHDRLEKAAKAHGGDALVKDHHQKAAAAAAHIKKQISAAGHSIKHVHWTSKSGDVERVSGIKSSQKEDPSDIMVTTKKGKHVGISLKVSKKTSKVPASSLGMTSGGRKAARLGAAHKKAIADKHKGLSTTTNKQSRKDWAKANPKAHADIKASNKKLLGDVAKKQSRELKARMRVGHVDHVINHMRQVMHAKSTPMQAHGHDHIKHTTWRTAKGVQTKSANPGKDHEHIFNAIKKNPHKLKITHTSGGSVNFHYNGKKVVTQSHKFDSQSDPLSTLKSAGHIA